MDSAIIKKLRFSPTLKTTIINAPERFYEDFCSLREGVEIDQSFKNHHEWVLAFVATKSEVDKWSQVILKEADPETIIWFAYPKKSSSIKTDISRDNGWEALHNQGWQGVSLISLDETWSAFRVRTIGKSPSSIASDDSIKAASGRNWKEWYQQLELDQANGKSHQEIAKLLSSKYNLDGWWSQMITNAYEQHIGRRKKHQRASGFEASVSKTFPLSLPKAYEAFVNEKERKKWMKDPGFEITTERENRSIRASWVDGKTRISVEFYSKGDNKCQVVVQHMKLLTSEDCAKMKQYWKENLNNLPVD
jgi:hypothetical protein